VAVRGAASAMPALFDSLARAAAVAAAGGVLFFRPVQSDHPVTVTARIAKCATGIAVKWLDGALAAYSCCRLDQTERTTSKTWPGRIAAADRLRW
jgi:hypothetical protein